MIIDWAIFVGVLAAVCFVISFWKRSLILEFVDLILWIFLFANVINIEIPYQAATEYPIGSGIMNITTGVQAINEPGLQALMLIPIFVMIVLLIVDFMSFKQDNRFGL